ncbi:MAG: mRNA interferase RelE/StbE [Lysobacterales bacterium]
MYKVVLLSGAIKFYNKLYDSDRSKFERIANALTSLQEDPFQGKSLKHLLKAKYSLRVGVYRIIYKIEKKVVTVYILDIGHRKDIYEGRG